MDVLSLMSFFRMQPGFKLSIEHNNFHQFKIQLVSRTFFHEVNQTFKIGGRIGYGDSYLEFLFDHSKVFRLHTKIQNAGGTVRLHSGKEPS